MSGSWGESGDLMNGSGVEGLVLCGPIWGGGPLWVVLWGDVGSCECLYGEGVGLMNGPRWRGGSYHWS